MKLARLLALLLLLLLLANTAAYAAADENDAPYYITIDITNQIVTVYRSDDHSDSGIVRQMICSTGLNSSTPTGTFTLPKKTYSSERTEWYYFSKYKIYAKYATRIYSGILFHSILFKHHGDTEATWASTNALGSPASHGCIRLRVADAQWIAENCLSGTKVNIFYADERDSKLRTMLKQMTFTADEMEYSEFRILAQSLYQGSSGDDVRALQSALTELGYDCGSIDGKFGSKTTEAVLAYQKASRLEESGNVSPELLTEITSAADVKLAAAIDHYAEIEVNPVYGVNLRATASAEADILDRLEDGTSVGVLEAGDEWSKVYYDGHTGYVKNAYLITPAESASPAPDAALEAESASPAPDATLEIINPAPSPSASAAPSAGASAAMATASASEQPIAEDVPLRSEAPTVAPESTDAAADEAGDQPVTATVHVNPVYGLNLRDAPDSNGKVINRMNDGENVVVLEIEDEWSKIEYEGDVGYAMNEYLTFNGVDETVIGSASVVVNPDFGLNLRAKPDTGAHSLTLLDNGAALDLLSEDGDWCRVRYNGQTGFVKTEYLVITRNSDKED